MNILTLIALSLQLSVSSPSTVIVIAPQASPASGNILIWGEPGCTWLAYGSIVCKTVEGATTLGLTVQMDCSVETAFLTVWEYNGGANPVQRIVYVDNTANCTKPQNHHRQFLPMMNR